jgi:hypothetical protein
VPTQRSHTIVLLSFQKKGLRSRPPLAPCTQFFTIPQLFSLLLSTRGLCHPQNASTQICFQIDQQLAWRGGASGSSVDQLLDRRSSSPCRCRAVALRVNHAQCRTNWPARGYSPRNQSEQAREPARERERGKEKERGRETTRVPSPTTLLPVFGSASKKKTIYFEILKKKSCEPRRNFLVPPLIKNLLPFP